MNSRPQIYLYSVISHLYSLYNKVTITHKSRETRNTILSFHLFSFFTTFKDYNPFGENVSKLNRYWVRQTVPDLLEDADTLFQDEKYLEVYELLNRLKFDNNAEVQWRVCRTLFKMSCDKSLSSSVRSEMVAEAYDVISKSVDLDPNNPYAHKWMAILTDAKRGLEGTVERVKSFNAVKTHLVRAAELNPHDVSVLYMLGKWCFTMSHFTWLQRKISSIFFTALPISTYEEAYNYFLRAEDLQPRFYLPNLYMLGRTSFYMNQYYRARYYLHIAAHIPPRTDFEKRCAMDANALACQLQQFDVSRHALLSGVDAMNSNFD